MGSPYPRRWVFNHVSAIIKQTRDKFNYSIQSTNNLSILYLKEMYNNNKAVRQRQVNISSFSK